MNSYEDPNLLTLGMQRIFVQEDGASPDASYNYHGGLSLGGINEPQGDITQIDLPSPDQHGDWEIAGIFRGVQGLPTTDFTARMMKTLQSVWWKFRKNRCAFNAQLLIGECDRPDDWNTWLAKVLLNTNYLTDLTLPVANPLSGSENDVGNLTGSLTMRSFDVLYPLTFQEYADTVLLAEAIDGFYSNNKSCGECGDEDDGCNELYVLTIADTGSPGLSSQVVYTRDDKSTWVTRDIPVLGGLSADKIVRMGKYVVVVSEASGGHAHISFTNLHTNSVSSWELVQSGYAVGGSPRAIYALSSNRAVVVGAGGYIYRLKSPTASPTIISDGSITTQNFNDVEGIGNTVVAVGNAGAVVVSTNKGASFTLKPAVDQDGSTIVTNITAIGMISPRIWFIGTDGDLYFTKDAGETYTKHTDWPDNIDVINDISFATPRVGYIAAESGGVGRVYRTDSMGYQWDNDAPSIDGLPTGSRYSFVEPCGINECAAGGRVAAGGDGILAIAQ